MPNFTYIPSAGMIKLLDLKRQGINAAGYTVGIFVNAPVLTPVLTMAGITEATFPGYVRQNLPTLGVPVTNASAPDADSTGATLTFLCTGAGSADTYGGWFMCDAGGNLVCLGYSNIGVVAFDAAGKFVNVTPRITEARYAGYP